MENHIELLPKLITPNIAVALIPAFTAAYEMAFEAATNIDFLAWDLRPQILPHLKNWAVEFELKRRAEQGKIPFQCEVVQNKRKNHRHIELINKNLIITVSQVSRPTELPRESIFRNQYSIDGQTVLEPFYSADSLPEETPIYAILTHGWQTQAPAFISCGIPAPDMACWTQYLDIFEMVRNLSLVDASPITQDIKLEFRESALQRASGK